MHCLVASFPYSNMRYAVALPGRERGVRAPWGCSGCSSTSAPCRRCWCPDDATGAAHRVSWDRIVVVEVFQRFVAHHRIEVRFCDPGAGNEKGGEGERGRVPAPQRDGAVAERRVACAAGGGSCSPGATGSPRIPIAARASRSGTCSRGIGRRWPPMPGTRFDRVPVGGAQGRWRGMRGRGLAPLSRGSRRGAGGRSTSGCARSTRGIRTRDGRRVGKLPRAYGGDTGTVRDPAVLLPALARKPRAWGREPHTRGFPRQAPAEHRRDGVQGAAGVRSG